MYTHTHSLRYDFNLLTEYAGHAQSMIKKFDLSSVDAIIIASGDGLLFEVSVCECVHDMVVNPICDCIDDLSQTYYIRVHVIISTCYQETQNPHFL